MAKIKKIKQYQQERMAKMKKMLHQKKIQSLDPIDLNSTPDHHSTNNTGAKLANNNSQCQEGLSQLLIPKEKNADVIYDTSCKVGLTQHISPVVSESKSEQSDDDEVWLITTEKENMLIDKIIRRRVVNISYFTQQLLALCDHGPLGCSAKNMVLINEKQKGLESKFYFQCNMCNQQFTVNNDNCEENFLKLNSCAVASTVAIGCGQSQLEELLSGIDLPTVTEHLYEKNHKLVSEHWKKVSEEKMVEAGKKEREIAIGQGRVTKDGIGVVDVVVDGCWSKRSYKKNYSAPSGAAAIIGKNTGEILYLGIKNKYCQVCAKAEKEKIEAKEHLCFKNYEGPSTGMESQILVEGFKMSIEQHGLIYGRMVSDGDSSTYAKIVEARPYPNTTVEKVECRNHIMRNFCNKLQLLSTETKYPLPHRKCVTKKAIMSMRAVIIKNIGKHKTNSDVQLLFEDILLCAKHAFGDHTKCKTYFCSRKGTIDNVNVPKDFFSGALWQRINFLVQGVAAHSRSLILDVDSNVVENFHSVVAKWVGGKRINYSKKNSYALRCQAAAVAFNTKKSVSRLYKAINGGKSPGGRLKRLEEKRTQKSQRNKCNRKPRQRCLFPSTGKNKDYGETCVKPDMDPSTFLEVKKNFIENLNKTNEERDAIQKNTILQNDSGEWLELRRSLLTSSNFGKVIRRREYTSCVNAVKRLLYSTNLDLVPSIRHGRKYEPVALKQLSSQLNIEIRRCGLFIDKELPFLGATPDGLCGDDTIIEVKCPITAHVIGMNEAIEQKKVNFWKNTKKGTTVNKIHFWYYQVQGQLHITQRSKCIFAAWANENEPLKIEIIHRDDNFWRSKMVEKLTKFYMECILPELIDPRHPRHLTIRDPAYIIDEIKKKQEKDKNKQENAKSKRSINSG